MSRRRERGPWEGAKKIVASAKRTARLLKAEDRRIQAPIGIARDFIW